MSRKEGLMRLIVQELHLSCTCVTRDVIVKVSADSRVPIRLGSADVHEVGPEASDGVFTDAGHQICDKKAVEENECLAEIVLPESERPKVPSVVHVLEQEDNDRGPDETEQQKADKGDSVGLVRIANRLVITPKASLDGLRVDGQQNRGREKREQRNRIESTSSESHNALLETDLPRATVMTASRQRRLETRETLRELLANLKK